MKFQIKIAPNRDFGEHQRPEVKVIFQTVEICKNAFPDHTGDWYFTGIPDRRGTVVVEIILCPTLWKENHPAY